MTQTGSDSNLLFGILALQMDFIRRDQLIEAMQAWVLDKSRTLGQILVDRGDLQPHLQATIDQLVAAHTAQLGSHSTAGDELTVAHDLTGEELRLEAAGRENTIPHSESDLAVNGESMIIHRSSAPTSDIVFGEVTTESGRFQRLKLHNEGGLGTVWVAQDKELDRKVAVKEIKERFADDEPSRRRFMLEAEITGGLEHPGVVPVYGFGRYRDGRPFYAMRFIRGTSLREAIRDFHQTDWRTSRPSETREIVLRRLLSRFIDVCNTIYYAHRRGILHRDIKPSNIMLGDYGETLVVDWGLAKSIHRSDGPSDSSLPSESTLMPRAGDKVAETILGHAIGSPPYMSPEQANGEQDNLGPATDIYSLGTTLYTLLTDQRPFEGNSTEEILQSVRTGEFRRPREIKSNIPRPLESICLKAMALKPSDRYSTVRHLVRDLEQYLADEPISAHRESHADRLRRVSRRHRSLFVVGLASLVLISMISVAAAIVVNQMRMSAQTLAIVADQAATAESKARRQAIAKQKESELAKERSDRVREYLADLLRSPNPERDGRKVTVVELLDSQIDRLKQSFGDDDLVRAQLLGVMGETYSSLGQLSKSIELSQQAYDLSLRSLGANAADDPQTLEAQRQLVVTTIQAGRARQTLPLAMDYYKRCARVFGRHSAKGLQAQQVLAECYLGTGRIDKAVEILESVYQQTQATAQDHDTDRQTMVAATSLISGYVAAERLEDAVQLGSQAVIMQRQALGIDHPLTLRTMTIYATALQLTGRVDEAISMLKETLDGKTRKLGELHADTLQAEFALILAFVDAGEEADASRHIKQLTARLQKSKSFGEDSMLAYKTTLLGILADADLLSVLKGRKDVVQTLSSLSATAPSIALNLFGWVTEGRIFEFLFSSNGREKMEAMQEIRRMGFQRSESAEPKEEPLP